MQKMSLFVLALAVLVGRSVPAASGTQWNASNNKGMAVGLYYLSGAALTNAVADLKRMGVKWVRMDFPWNLMEANGPGAYNTGPWDAAVAATAAVGIHMVGVIDYTPVWSRPPGTNQFYPPTDMSRYANFAGFLATRYSPGGVHTWEIWNEENGATFWQPKPNPAAYLSMLEMTWPALKTADPSAFIILGGMATFGDDGTNYNARTFLNNIYALGGEAYFDAVAMHPYTYPTLPGSSPSNNWGQMSVASDSLRSEMIANGDSAKKIWITEMGYPTVTAINPALTEAGQASYLRQAYQLQATYTWAGPLFWYTYQDSGIDRNNPEDWFGLLRFNGSQKPAYWTYRQLAN